MWKNKFCKNIFEINSGQRLFWYFFLFSVYLCKDLLIIKKNWTYFEFNFLQFLVYSIFRLQVHGLKLSRLGSLHKYTENKKNIKKVVDRYFFQKYFYNIYSFTNRPSLNSFKTFPNFQLYKIESCSTKIPKRKIFLFSIKFSFYSQIYTKFRLHLQQQNTRSATFKVLRSPNFFMFIDS